MEGSPASGGTVIIRVRLFAPFGVTYLFGSSGAGRANPTAWPYDTLDTTMLFTKIVAHALARHGLEVRGDAPFPRQLAPMLMHSADTLIASPDFTYEPKWDGFRVLAAVRDSSVRLLSRNGHSFTRLFGPVTDASGGFPRRWSLMEK